MRWGVILGSCGVFQIPTFIFLHRVYGNEREVGEGLRASGVPRSEVFVRIVLLISIAVRAWSAGLLLAIDHQQVVGNVSQTGRRVLE